MGAYCPKYIVRFVHKGIYVCGYLDDGLTKNSIQCRRNSPEYSALAYSEFMNYPQIPIKYKFAYAINFWRFSVKGKKSFLRDGSKEVFGLYWLGFLVNYLR